MDDLLQRQALDRLRDDQALVPHESAHKHVTGRAEYIDDMAEPAGTLHAYLGLSAHAHAQIVGLDLSAVEAAPGVVGVVTSADIPGRNDISPAGIGDDPLFCVDRTSYHGQPLFAVVGRTRDAVRRAARLAKVAYRALPHRLTALDALENGGNVVAPGMVIASGDAGQALARAPHTLAGRMTIGGQEHFYLEGQVSLAIPGEDGEMLLHTATQHPSDTQEVVARVLGLEANGVRVHVRRLGGGFGGKETQGTLFGAVAAVAARKFGRAVKCRPDRDDDMVITGKRHDFVVDYRLGFDEAGRIEALDAVFNARCGHSEDLSRGVTDRALMHADNAYFFPAMRVESKLLRTNTVSNTAFRGYGGPQGILAAERIIEEIAYALGRDTLDIRKINLYDGADRNTTPYGQEVHDNIMARIVAELEASSDYRRRREEILAFNRSSEFVRRGIALVPVKYGISFSKKLMNQGAALLNLYRDGSVHLNHGGTEMGQGLHTKVAQVVAHELNIALRRIRVTPTATDKVPNASPTAGSLGTDLNGMAALDAARTLKRRLVAFAVETFRVHEEQVSFEFEAVRAGSQLVAWPDFVEMAYAARVPLSATGFYKTPHIHWDRKSGRGSPYLYFTYGASCSEVAVDTLTGEYKVLRTDILQDVGRSINRDIDIGQIEGGFIQGMGWLTTEELWWDKEGRLRTHAPSTYKIPVASDRPRVFNVALAEWSVNPAPTVRNSKATGEPPIMLAISVFEALGMAAASVAGYRFASRLDSPATPERVLMAMERLKREARAAG
ncbi:aldehyde oxidase [Devosia geojensis]|uniref:Aldehyde oxidase n=1 Tax=Devosia geojensis TaxID=443610 RepID=A0A0F5FTU4_9HYPH|nr:xanthine dehydrogenase molybdopterin binding subunit [Devosia geojensis]KKB12243.1 aldehyde oxidase [Devosia geojensis]